MSTREKEPESKPSGDGCELRASAGSASLRSCYDEKFAPVRCKYCGGEKFDEVIKDITANVVCESEIRCAVCERLVSYWAYGNYDHEFTSEPNKQ